MANKKYEEADIQAIATTIREKTGTDKLYDTSEMASGVNEVYDAGKKASQIDFINMLSNDGVRVAYRYVFEGADFSGYTFNPIIYPTRLGTVFYNYAGVEFPSGIDFSKANIAESVTDTAMIPYNTFAYCRNQERIPDMNIPVQYRYTNTYTNCYVKKIDIIRVAETTLFSNSFSGCNYLEDVAFEGVIGRNISFSVSPLTVESMKGIITHLKNYTGTDYEKTYTLTLKSSCVTELETAEFTASDMDELYKKGINVTDDMTWVDVIDDLKWNLVTA